MIRAVVFDLFETLVTESGLEALGPSTAGELGMAPLAYREAWRSWKHRRHTAPVDARDVWAEISGLGRGDPVLDRLHASRQRRKDAPLAAVEPAVMSMLRELRDRRFLVLVLSNCAVEDVAGWSSSSLSSLVDDVIFSWQVGLVKPDVRIYELAATRLGLTADECLFVGRWRKWRAPRGGGCGDGCVARSVVPGAVA